MSQETQKNKNILVIIAIIYIIGIIVTVISAIIILLGVFSPNKTIVGLWERVSSENTEYLNFKSDGSYTVEAKSNSTNTIMASNSGTFTYDKDNIYYADKSNKKITESYYLDNDGDLLVINNKIDVAWNRIK